MKFIKVYHQNRADFSLINLANVDSIDVMRTTGTIAILLSSGNVLSVPHSESPALLKQVSEYNRQIIEYLIREDLEEPSF